MMTNVELLAKSAAPNGVHAYTFRAVFPRIILAEVLTHRAFSRNTASSRAIPIEKMIQSVIDYPFIPMAWQKAHNGMQGTEHITDPEHILDLRVEWIEARDAAVRHARQLHALGASKQVINRLLEPFSYVTMIITTEQDGLKNFLNQRFHPDAEMHMMNLALQMKEAIFEPASNVDVHLPFGLVKEGLFESIVHNVAMCARTSFTTIGDTREYSYESNLNVFKKLCNKDNPHWSPFEHILLPGTSQTNTPNFLQLRYLLMTRPHLLEDDCIGLRRFINLNHQWKR